MQDISRSFMSGSYADATMVYDTAALEAMKQQSCRTNVLTSTNMSVESPLCYNYLVTAMCMNVVPMHERVMAEIS